MARSLRHRSASGQPGVGARWDSLKSTSLSLELSGTPLNGGRYPFGPRDLAKPRSMFGRGRVKRADDIESGVERGAKTGCVRDSVDGALGRVKRLRRDHRQELRIGEGLLAPLSGGTDAIPPPNVLRRRA